jgi:hypothetical protein
MDATETTTCAEAEIVTSVAMYVSETMEFAIHRGTQPSVHDNQANYVATPVNAATLSHAVPMPTAQ